jgi:protein-S-isoprenylcysteine O-methyltransferase Ste14
MTVFDEIRIALFIAITVGVAVASRRSLRNVRAHGFWRFISWVAIAALVMWNLPQWISEPFSPRQVLSWIILFASLYVLWAGVTRLRAARRSGRRTDSELYAFERTTELVTTGIYRYIRHPLYASLLYLAWGAFLKEISWVSSVLVVLASASLLATAKADEKECVGYFGDPYREYMQRTKMFIPFVL